MSNDDFYRKTYPWMTDDHWRCACLIAEVFRGFHHLNEFKQRSDGVSVNITQNDLATYDFSELTQLVILAHDRCIRVSIATAGMRLQIRAWPRVRDGNMFDRHPTMEQAIAKFRPVTEPVPA